MHSYVTYRMSSTIGELLVKSFSYRLTVVLIDEISKGKTETVTQNNTGL